MHKHKEYWSSNCLNMSSQKKTGQSLQLKLRTKHGKASLNVADSNLSGEESAKNIYISWISRRWFTSRESSVRMIQHDMKLSDAILTFKLLDRSQITDDVRKLFLTMSSNKISTGTFICVSSNTSQAWQYTS